MDEHKPSSLIRKLCEVMAAVDRIPKRGTNTFHNYKYAMEADVADAVRDELAKRNVLMVADFQSLAIREKTNRSGNTEFLADVEVRFTFIDGDTGDRESFVMPGCGQDSGDKAIFKAITGAQKYALMKTFLIPTGDDPENEGEQEKGGRGKPAAKPQAQRPANPPAPPATAPAASAPPEQRRQNPEATINEAQLTRMYAIAGSKKWTKEAAKDLVTRYGYESSKDIKVKDYDAMCAELEKGPALWEVPAT